MKTRLYISALFFLFLTALTAQNKLYLNYPQWGWEDMGPGTIDEAVFTLKPQGLYVEVGMYLTFSFPENSFESGDSLEIVFDFNLPGEAIVNDSWLWVGEQVVRAEIWDIWSAMQTYEEIVEWQQDPSILFKKPDGGYQLRIFPLVELQSRKVKINYLLPAHWTKEEVIAALPVDLLATSFNPLSDLTLVVFPDPAWQNYRIAELPGQLFEPVTYPEWGDCLQMQVNSSNWSKPMHFEMDAPLSAEGVFVGKYTGGEGNVYHLAFFPDQYLVSEKSSHLMLVVDYQTWNSTFQYEELTGFLKESLQARLDENDFFNLLIGKDKNKAYMAFPAWMPFDSASIEEAFANYVQVPLGNSVPLVQLLLQAGDFMEANPENGEMLLVSNTHEYGWTWDADEALDQLQAEFPGWIAVNICDYQNTNFYYDCPFWWTDDNCYTGNEYFNLNLSVTTGGRCFNLQGKGADLQTNLSALLNTLDGVPAVYDLYTDMASGLCYQRYPVNYLGQSEYMHLPILQVGKYEGDFPMTVEFSAFQDGQLITETFEVPENQVVQLDTLAEESWVGNYLEVLESNEDAVNQVIDVSIQHRVLSKYTAFIALDPTLGGEPCFECKFDGPIIIEATEQRAEDEPLITAFPNPFRDEVAFRLRGIDALEVRIFDRLGHLVRILEPAHTLLWDGRSDEGTPLPAGVYFLWAIEESGKYYLLKISKL